MASYYGNDDELNLAFNFTFLFAPFEAGPLAGVVRQTLRNWTLTALAIGGVHPDRLAAFYPAVR